MSYSINKIKLFQTLKGLVLFIGKASEIKFVSKADYFSTFFFLNNKLYNMLLVQIELGKLISIVADLCGLSIWFYHAFLFALASFLGS